MWSKKPFLLLCEKLKHAGLGAEFEIGDRIGRGYADLGAEEFYCLSGGKIVSIYSGTVSALTPEHKQHFFLIPDLPRIVNEIQRRGFEISQVEFENQRHWKFAVKAAGNHAWVSFRNDDIRCGLAEALAFCLEASR